MAADGKLEPRMLSGKGATDGHGLVYRIGRGWGPEAVGAAVIVDDDEPSSPATGQLWYDTDDTC